MAAPEGIIVKDDGFPATALLTHMKAVTVHPPKSAAWICLALRSEAHEAVGDQRRYAEVLPQASVQFALDPATAHQLGMYLIEAAKAVLHEDD